MTQTPERRRRRKPLRSHPTRDRIVDALRTHDGPLSPTQLSRAIGASLGATAYHVRVLEETGVLALTREGRARGAVEHFYELSGEPGERSPLGDPLATLLGLCGALMQPVPDVRRLRPTPLDDEARDALQGVLDRIRPEVEEIAAAASQRSGRRAR